MCARETATESLKETESARESVIGRSRGREREKLILMESKRQRAESLCLIEREKGGR